MKILLLLLIFIFCAPAFLFAQTAEEWIEQAEKAEQEAETAEAEGRDKDAQNAWREAATARANAAEEQVENGDYEEAAENYEKAADQFEKAGNEGQAAAERIKASSNYDSAADEAERKGETKKAKALREKAAAAKKAAERSIDASITAKSTGQTTGHIANLTVTNTGLLPLKINEQTVYIPSDGGYQPYVATIPETTIPPKGTTDIPVNGYCADVHTPPVPNGTGMPPTDAWIPVGDANQPVPNGTTNIIPNPTKPTFTPGDIPGITNSPGYTPNPPGTEGDIITNWPGTDIPVGGVIDPGHYPWDFAPVIVDILHHIEVAADIILKKDEYPTPFTNDPVKEREAVIQQTFWIAMADITGEEYNRDGFMERLYDQFQTTTGKPVTSLPDEQKEQVDLGVDDFWKVFTAVGVEAKVLKAPESDTDTTVPVQDTKTDDQPKGKAEEKEIPACACKDAYLTISVKQKRNGKEIKQNIPAISLGADHKTHSLRLDNNSPVELNSNDELIITIDKYEADCDKCENNPCKPDPKTIKISGKGTVDFQKPTEIKGTDGKYAESTLKVKSVDGKPESNPVEINFLLEWTCKQEPCKEAKCEVTYTLKIDRSKGGAKEEKKPPEKPKKQEKPNKKKSE